MTGLHLTVTIKHFHFLEAFLIVQCMRTIVLSQMITVFCHTGNLYATEILETRSTLSQLFFATLIVVKL